MNHFIKFFLTQRTLVLLMSFAILSLGWVAFQKTPIDAFPDVSPVQVKLIFKAPGMTPSEVEQRVISPLEQELLGIPNQTTLRSLAKYAIADITLDFTKDTDPYWARQLVAERLNNIELPAGVSGGMAPLSTPLSDIFMFTLEGDTLNNMEKRELLDWVIRPALRSVPGVADVNALGGKVKIFAVKPDYAKLQAYQISLSTLIEVLENNNQNDGAGRINAGEEVLLVRTEGNLTDISDIENLIVAYQNQKAIRIKDLAQVEIDALYRNGSVTKDGQSEAVQGLVMALKGANAREVVLGIEQRLKEIEIALPDGISLNIFYNRNDLIQEAIYTVSKALTEAVVLVLIILVLLLGNFRAALTVAFILPLAALMTFIFMKIFGLSANLMSLGGLAIAIGILVDAAVVVVENIVAHQERNKAKLPKLHIIYRAVQEVSAPVIAGILIIMIVFLPLLTLEGIEGKLFTPVALTIIFALGSSLLIALTIIPSISSPILTQGNHQEPWLIRKISTAFQPMLIWSLKNPKTILGIALSAMLGAGFLYTQVGKTFIPQMDEGYITLQMEKYPSTGLEASINLDLNVQKVLMEKVPEIQL